tara:strand:- start:3423 stop:4415 length:993 start_codon:yes stop_codon:yes gene_type:complete
VKNLNSSILITGGTGSFGSGFISYLTKNFKINKRLIIFSRDELKQFEMKKKYPFKKYPNLRFFLGDIRDYERLNYAMDGVDIVIHAAALKQVPAAEYNPTEVIKTNILGSQNVVTASINNKVKKSILLSTDKASSPINLYGASKLCADKLFISANNFKGSRPTVFSVVRYGNVMGSRGSIIPILLQNKEKKKISLTDQSMTRFNITLGQSINLVFEAIKNSIGGEIFVPKIPSYKLIDLAKSVNKNFKIKFIGIREGEKIHEELISQSDIKYSIDVGRYYIILPFSSELQKKILKKYPAWKKFDYKNSYNSRDNKIFLSQDEIKKLLKKL